MVPTRMPAHRREFRALLRGANRRLSALWPLAAAQRQLRGAAVQASPAPCAARWARLEAETDTPEDATGILSLHYFEAGGIVPRGASVGRSPGAPTRSRLTSKRPSCLTRALDATHRLSDISDRTCHRSGCARGFVDRSGGFAKAGDGYTAARRRSGPSAHRGGVAAEAFAARREAREVSAGVALGGRARKALAVRRVPDTALQAARSSSWIYRVLQAQGRNADAIGWADQAIAEAEAIDDPDAFGTGSSVKGWTCARSATRDGNRWCGAGSGLRRSGDRVQRGSCCE